MNAPVLTPEPYAHTFNPPPAQRWAWWRAALKGDIGPYLPLSPQQGFYRYRPKKRDRGEPCAVWFADGQWFAEIGGVEADDVEMTWRFGHQNPISAELYKAVLAGGSWPDELDEAQPEVAGLGHNSRRPEEEVRDEIEAADAAFAAWLQEIGGSIMNEEQDTKADAYAKRFLGFEKRIKDAHQSAKAPALEECRRIDAAWISGSDSVKAYAEACKKRVGEIALPYRVERKRKQDEADRLAREAAEQERQQRAIAAQKAAEAGRTFAPMPSTRPMGTFTPKKAAGFASRKVGRIDDLPKVSAFIAAMPLDASGNHPRPEFAETCRKIVEAMLKAGVVVEGAHLEEEFSAR